MDRPAHLSCSRCPSSRMVAPYVRTLSVPTERRTPRSSYRLPTPSSGCTRSSSDASRPNACCPAPTPLACCSGHYWPAGRLPFAKLTAGRPCISPLPSKFLIWWHKPITSPSGAHPLSIRRPPRKQNRAPTRGCQVKGAPECAQICCHRPHKPKVLESRANQCRVTPPNLPKERAVSRIERAPLGSRNALDAPGSYPNRRRKPGRELVIRGASTRSSSSPALYC